MNAQNLNEFKMYLMEELVAIGLDLVQIYHCYKFCTAKNILALFCKGSILAPFNINIYKMFSFSVIKWGNGGFSPPCVSLAQVISCWKCPSSSGLAAQRTHLLIDLTNINIKGLVGGVGVAPDCKIWLFSVAINDKLDQSVLYLADILLIIMCFQLYLFETCREYEDRKLWPIP